MGMAYPTRPPLLTNRDRVIAMVGYTSHWRQARDGQNVARIVSRYVGAPDTHELLFNGEGGVNHYALLYAHHARRKLGLEKVVQLNVVMATRASECDPAIVRDIERCADDLVQMKLDAIEHELPPTQIRYAHAREVMRRATKLVLFCASNRAGVRPYWDQRKEGVPVIEVGISA